jgi:hypothetical protein
VTVGQDLVGSLSVSLSKGSIPETKED